MSDNSEDESHFYLGQLSHWPSIAIVASFFFEGEEDEVITFISNKTGAILCEYHGDIDMHVSPDGCTIAITQEDLDLLHAPNKLWIYEINDEQAWVLLWETGSDVGEPEAGFAKPQWISNSELEVTRIESFRASNRNIEVREINVMRVEFDGQTWQAQ